MKKILILLGLALGIGLAAALGIWLYGNRPVVAVDEAHFPDEIFREYVRVFDKNGDGVLSAREISNAKYLDMEHAGAESVEGIGYLTALEGLWCGDNRLTELDLSQNAALESLYCYQNGLTKLDTGQNPALITLYCWGNELTDLDVTQNAALEALVCWGNTLTELDLSRNTALERLNCSFNELDTLDVSRCAPIAERMPDAQRVIHPERVCWEYDGVEFLSCDLHVRLITQDGE